MTTENISTDAQAREPESALQRDEVERSPATMPDHVTQEELTRLRKFAERATPAGFIIERDKVIRLLDTITSLQAQLRTVTEERDQQLRVSQEALQGALEVNADLAEAVQVRAEAARVLMEALERIKVGDASWSGRALFIGQALSHPAVLTALAHITADPEARASDAGTQRPEGAL